MKKVFYKFFLIIIILIFAGNIAFADNLQNAFTPEGNPSPLEITAGNAGYNPSTRNVEPVISAVIQSILSFLGVIFVLLVIYGGFLWMTAKGNEQYVEKAKNTLMYAAIGLAIVIAAYAISYFVISKFTEKALDAPEPNFEEVETIDI